MSLSVAGVWQVDTWDQTVWADGVWREGAASVVPVAPDLYAKWSTIVEIKHNFNAGININANYEIKLDG